MGEKKKLKSMVIIPVWENIEIIDVLKKFEDKWVDEVTLVIDEPRSDFIEIIKKNANNISSALTILENPKRMGIGNAIRMGLQYGLSKNYDVAVIMAGNGKDDPREIPKFIKKIEEGYDYVQGSRYLKGGRYDGLPIQRKIFTRVWPIFWSLITWKKVSEVTNGFRAYRFSILNNPEINLNQEWLNDYSLEYYIHYHVLKKKDIKYCEIPISKIYKNRKKYTKINPLKDWQSIILPPILLLLRIRK
ncbi:MAG: glycosyltransferase family 2 protein [Candidatus Helarchaeota archaeon]